MVTLFCIPSSRDAYFFTLYSKLALRAGNNGTDNSVWDKG